VIFVTGCARHQRKSDLLANTLDIRRNCRHIHILGLSQMTAEFTNGVFAVGGAILGGIATAWFTWFFSKRSEKKRILAAYFSPFSKLVQVSTRVASKVTIHIEGEPVEDLYVTELTVLNLGNASITNISLSIDPGVRQHVVTYDVDERALREIGVEVILPGATHTYELAIPFLNPGDEFRLRFYVASKTFVPSASFRQADVEFRTGVRESSRIPNVMAEVLFAAIQRNWLMDAYFSAVLPVYRSFKKEKNKQA
jgi:hypothetical protein